MKEFYDLINGDFTEKGMPQQFLVLYNALCENSEEFKDSIAFLENLFELYHILDSSVTELKDFELLNKASMRKIIQFQSYSRKKK